MFELFSTILRFIFTAVIYLFIYSIIRLIYLDIHTINGKGAKGGKGIPYLKLINMRESLNFRVEENYALDGKVVIGRGNRSDIVIKDPYMSGEHVHIENMDGQYMLNDMGTTNGTSVNGRIVNKTPIVLKDGDRIHMGQLEFLFVSCK